MKGSWQEILKRGLQLLHLEFNDRQKEELEIYLKLLIDFNRRINLTSIDEPREIVVKHFLDSLVAFKHIPPHSSVIDIGTGGGFPGIPLKILQPSLQMVLIDSVKKKIDFLNLVIQKLGLKNIEAYHVRAEELGHDDRFREQFDICLSRAVSSLSVLLEYQLPLLKEGGLSIIYKARGVEQEVKEAEEALNILGGRVLEIEPQDVPFLQAERNLILIKKIRKTPARYPRRPGMPEKRPL